MTESSTLPHLVCAAPSAQATFLLIPILSRAQTRRLCHHGSIVSSQRPALPPEGLCLYDLRHTCAALLIARRASVKAVQKQLVHKTVSITLDTYGHLFPSELEVLGERLEAVREAARKKRPRTQDGPVVVALRKAASQKGGG
jgi:integrase